MTGNPKGEKRREREKERERKKERRRERERENGERGRGRVVLRGNPTIQKGSQNIKALQLQQPLTALIKLVRSSNRFIFLYELKELLEC